jgi:Ca-activated chloride channel family protein
MNFGQVEFLYALILLPLMLLISGWAALRRRAAIARLGDPTLVSRLSANVNWQGRRWRNIFWFIGLLLIIVALARPQWGSEVEVVEQQGIEIMVALDISQSMLVEDIKPNRLSRAKLEIVDLMNHLEGNEIGLVLFSGDSFIQFPLTFDFGTARSFLENAHPGMISRPGTAIGDAIDTAIRGFNEQRASQRVILIMTDGENHEPGTLEAAQRAAEEGIIIYAIGFGSVNGEPVPRFNDQGLLIGFKKDANGQTIFSKLDETTLQQVSLTTGGRYFRSTASGRELDALVDELQQLEKTQLESRFETRRIERFQGFLAVALVALVLMEMIPDRKRRASAVEVV